MPHSPENRVAQDILEPSTLRKMLLTCAVMLVSAVLFGVLPLYIGPSNTSKVMVMGCIGAGNDV